MTIEGDKQLQRLSLNSSVGELMADPVAGPIVQQALAELMGGASDGDQEVPTFDVGMEKMLASFPVGRLVGFPGLPVTLEQIEGLIGLANLGR